MSEIFGIEYGGPSAGIIHQNRLVLAGSLGLPDVLAASKIGDWTDFALGTKPTSKEDPTPISSNDASVEGFVATEADGFWIEQSSSRNNGFHALLQQEGLFIFGEEGESVVPPGPFTAARVEVRENSWFGMDPGRQPLISEGLVVFLQAGGGDIRGIRWTEEGQKYESVSLKELAGEVFDEGIDLTAQGSGEGDAPAVFVVGANGDMGLCSIRQKLQWARQAILTLGSWTTWDLDFYEERRRGGRIVQRKVVDGGRIQGTATVGREPVFLVERGQGRQGPHGQGAKLGLEYLVALEPNEPAMDARVQLARRGALTAPQYLQRQGVVLYWDTGERQRDGEALWARSDPVDWSVQPFYPSGLVLPEDLDTPVYAGLPYCATVETVPFVARTESGSRSAVLRSRIFELIVSWLKEGVHGPLDQRPQGTAGPVSTGAGRGGRGRAAVWEPVRIPPSGDGSAQAAVRG